MKRFSLIFFVILALAPTELLAKKTPAPKKKSAKPKIEYLINLSEGRSTVEFEAKANPGNLTISGEAAGAPVKGKLTVSGLNITGSAKVRPAKLKTGISIRDVHMHTKYLEVGKHPWSTLEITKAVLPRDPHLENDHTSKKTKFKMPFEGKLTIKNRTIPIKGQVSGDLTFLWAHVATTFDVKLSDFRIRSPGYLGASVEDKISVRVEFRAPIEQKD